MHPPESDLRARHAWRSALSIVLCFLALLCSACASVQTTQSGEIGLDRKQYFKEGIREWAVQYSAKAYNKMLLGGLSFMVVNPDPAVSTRVVKIANRLIPQVKNFRPDAEKWVWEVNVFDLPDVVNASCMAGGKIIVYTGLINIASDDELAAVIGHEIAHALRDHTAERISTDSRNSAFASFFTSVLGAGLAITTGVDATKTLNSVGQLSTDAIFNLPNSREHEAEADLIGLELMARAGFDPHGAANFWHKMIEQAKQSGKESASHSLWSTHPSDESRFATLSAMESKFKPIYMAALEENRKQQMASTPAGATTPSSKATSSILANGMSDSSSAASLKGKKATRKKSTNKDSSQ